MFKKFLLVCFVLLISFGLVYSAGDGSSKLSVKRLTSSTIYVYTTILSNLTAGSNAVITHPKDLYNTRQVSLWYPGTAYSNSSGNLNWNSVTRGTNFFVVKYTGYGNTVISNAGASGFTKVKVSIVIFR